MRQYMQCSPLTRLVLLYSIDDLSLPRERSRERGKTSRIGENAKLSLYKLNKG